MLLLGFKYFVQFIQLIDNCYSITTVRNFTRFDNPNVTNFLLLFSSVSWDMFTLLKILNKILVLSIVKTVFNVESQWYIIKHILSDEFVVLP
jgi:hypothetical protein